MTDTKVQLAEISPTPTVDEINPSIPSIAGPDERPKDARIVVSELPKNDVNSHFSKLPSTVKKLDGFISHLNRLMHTRESHDAVILFLAYATHFIATALETSTSERIREWSARSSRLISKNMPKRLSTLIPFPKLASCVAMIHACRPFLAERTRAISNILDDWQIITRLWGLLATWTDAKEYLVGLARTKDVEKERDKNPRDYLLSKVIRATYVVGLLSYYSFENLAWLTRRGVFERSEKTESKLMIWSLKGWGVYVFAELAQLFHDRSLRSRGMKEEDQDSKLQWRRRLVQMLLYGPLTVHWIKDGGLFPEVVASFLAAYTEYITVQALWRDTA
ncbi:hypothetical protein FLONG3_5157 [Fusarium longipes]|uniref:Peroxin 11c n=1 Tax=Fusarium longipes TaxID=694270 RepID=A0A395SWW8_9HYPO|nr:hypothetical protein FLONG3_5157 [Fusarium longipes]